MQTQLFRAPVHRVEELGPSLRRITLAGGDLGEFVNAGTDSHLVLYFYPPGAQLPEPLTQASARNAFSQVRPQMRSYTVRRFDPATTELDIDFVLHDDPGPASTWAAQAKPGDELIFVGPSPCYEPDPDATRFLLVGDESALPAIEAIVPELPAGVPVTVIVEVHGDHEHRELPVPVRWVHRERPADANALLAAVRGAGDYDHGTEVWLAGERAVTHTLRGYLLEQAGLSRDRVRATTYWRLGRAGT